MVLKDPKKTSHTSDRRKRTTYPYPNHQDKYKVKDKHNNVCYPKFWVLKLCAVLHTSQRSDNGTALIKYFVC